MSSPLLDLFQSQGHTLKREGQTYKTCCPFHQDDTPSLAVNPRKGLWHCFGCGEGGDGITFLERSLGLSFGQAADRWREFSGEDPKHSHPQNHPKEKGRTMNKLAQEISTQLTPEDITLFQRFQELYAAELGSNRKALAYLESRGITDPETVRAFGLGFVSGNSLPQLAPAQRDRLQDLGLLNSKGNESLYNCIVCPLSSKEGRVVGFWGRRILTGKNPHRSLPQNSSSVKAVVNRPALHSPELILVEGFLDALACHQAGLRQVIPVGTSQPRPELVQLLHRSGVKRVLLALDPDNAGEEGSKSWGEELETRGISSKRVRLPHDPCEFFKTGGTASAFRGYAREAEVVGRSDDSEYILDSNNLLYRVRALGGRQTPDKLKVQILVAPAQQNPNSPPTGHRDILNLYTHKSRKTFANAVVSRFQDTHPNLPCAAVETDLETITRALEERNRQKNEVEETRERPTLSPEEKKEALEFLSKPDLIRRLQDDMEALGYVGEDEAKLLVYLIATSRKLPRPLSGIIGSGSGAGKSFLAELAEQLTPPEEVELFSKLSSQVLYYLPKDYLRRKLLILEERAGGEGADYAIRTLQSKDRLTQMVTLKDSETGKMSAKHYEVMGPIAYLETTTQSYLNPENTSRCFEIPLDESAEQTRRIHEHQRRARSVDGLRNKVSRDAVRRKHHNAQRLLEEMRVVIPYAEKLTFPARYLRTRRDHERFLSLIEAVAFLHQFQRVVKTANFHGKQVKYIEATVEDYAIAYRLALRVLWVSLDELSRWARELINSCRECARQVVEEHGGEITAVTWTRRQLREFLGWPDKRLRACLDELVSLEYLQTINGSKGKTFIYRLNPNFSHNPQGLGLLTPDQLRCALQDEEPATVPQNS